MSGIDQLLPLRLMLLKNRPNVEILASKILNLESNNHNVMEIVKLLGEAIKTNKIIVLPLLISYDLASSNSIKHWVGIVGEIIKDKILITYLDSENRTAIPLFEQILIATFSMLFPSFTVLFKQIEVEQQRYNNCGYELIENIAFYLGDMRVAQESAPQLHSELWVQKLAMEGILQCQLGLDKNNRVSLSWCDRVMLQRHNLQEQHQEGSRKR